MLRRRLTALLTTALLLGVPTGQALADGGGAGDQEYQDPLTAPSTPHTKNKPAAKTAPASTPTTPPAPSPTTPASAAAPASTSQASAGELPRTGAPAGLVGATGVALIAAGLAVRRSAAQQP